MVIELNKTNLKSYLESKAIKNIKEIKEITKYTNVNYVFEVLLENNQKIFVKQAFGFVKVQPSMIIPLSRQYFEYLSLKWFYNLNNKIIPKVLQYDKENNVIIMQEVGENSSVLANLIGSGRLELQIIPQLARFCGKLHGTTYCTTEMIRPEKENKEHIDFIIAFRLKGSMELDKDETLNLFNESLNTKSSIIYGDFAFKNILVKGECFYLVDFENVCRFDPAFDIGYLFAHWFAEAKNKEDISVLRKNYNLFFEIYSEEFKQHCEISEKELIELNKRSNKYVGAIMAHRLFDTKKNPNLIEKDEKNLEFLRQISKKLLTDENQYL